MTVELDVAVEIEATPAEVWAVLVDWPRQSEWMADAKDVRVVSATEEGEGVTIHVPTDLLGLTVLDVMRVTDWDAPRRLEVVHLGKVIKGRGAFELEPLPGGRTRLVWREWIDPPLGRLGELGTRLVVKPFTERLFARSLGNLKALVERGS